LRHSRNAGRLIAGGLAALALALPADSLATFPGGNGYIHFIGRDADDPSSFDIWRVRPDDTGLKKLTDRPGGPDEGFDPTVARNSKRIAFTVGTQASSDVWVMRANGSNPTQLTFPAADPLQGLDQMPGISPDGRRIVFMTTRTTPPMASGLDYDIWMMNADGSGQTALVDRTGEEYHPEFTPDGQGAVMASEVTGDLDIAQVPIAGAPHDMPTAITGASNLQETLPTVAPDGQNVAFARRDPAQPFDRQFDILSIGIGGGAETPIATDNTVNETSSAFSPDGEKIVYTRPGSLVIANADGSDPEPIDLDEDRVVDPQQPDWAADTKRPRTRITAGPKGDIAQNEARFRFKSNEQASTFECKLDNRPYANCSSPRELNGVGRGSHTFRVRSTDFAGNTDSSPAERKFRVTG
jgi:TolB protein